MSSPASSSWPRFSSCDSCLAAPAARPRALLTFRRQCIRVSSLPAILSENSLVGAVIVQRQHRRPPRSAIHAPHVLTPLEQLISSFGLRIVWILDLDPRRVDAAALIPTSERQRSTPVATRAAKLPED